jgi:hypothetical protein
MPTIINLFFLEKCVVTNLPTLTVTGYNAKKRKKKKKKKKRKAIPVTGPEGL